VEGAILGVPAVAVSLNQYVNPDFTYAAQIAKKIIQTMVKQTLPPNTLLNINVPPGSETDIKGIAITKLGNRQYENTFDRRQDPRGRVYYWLGGDVMQVDNDPDSDIVAVEDGYVSVSPVHFDLTNYHIMHMLEQWNLNEIVKAPNS
jgi:5'-nucleotidase